jgi:maleylacetoacetate isomerase
MQLKLYSYWRSSAAYRVRIALNLKQLKYELISVDLRVGEHQHDDFSERNPQHLIPVLMHGDRIFRQSMAIIEYLEESFEGRGHRLIPHEPRERARVRGLSQLVACEIHPLNNLRVLKYLEQKLAVDEQARTAWMHTWIESGLAAFEMLLEGNPSTGDFCEGDHPTMADCLLIPQLYNARRFQVDLSPYPNAVRIEQAALALPEFEAARPENQPGAV